MRPSADPNPSIESFRRAANAVLLVWAGIGLVLMLAWPAARGYSDWIGHWPFWLLGAPLAALLALHRDPLARWLREAMRRPSAPMRSRRHRQARRAARGLRPASALRASLAALLPR